MCVCGCGVQSKSKADVLRVMVTVVEMIRIVKKMRMAVMPEIRLLMMMVAMIGFGFVARNIRSVGQQPRRSQSGKVLLQLDNILDQQ